MLKGFFSGGLWGLVVAAIGLTSASLLAPQPPGNAPPIVTQVTTPDVAEGAFDGVTAPEVAPVDPVAVADPPILADLAPAPQAAPPAVEPAAVMADTASADLPDASLDSIQPVAPAQTDAPELPTHAEVPVLPNPQTAAPQTPVAEADLVLSTEPAAAPPVPAPAGEEIVLVDPAPVEPVAEPSSVLPPAPPPVAPPAADDTIAVVVVPPVAEVVPEVIAPTSDPVVEIAPPIAPPDAEIAVTTPPPARIVMQGDAASLPQDDGGVRVNRPEDAVSATLNDAAVIPENIIPEGPALQAFAAVFSNPDGKPLMSIILIDDGAIVGAAAALSGVPFPLTVAIDASAADATARMAAYRAAGIDVMAMTDLPVGARPSDVEVVLESVFSTLPETIGLLDIGTGGLQSDQAVTDQAMARLAADGRGLVTISEGLNMALRSAENAAVPAGVIFRDLDADGQDTRVILRFLDQAAFRARQETGVILLARLRPDTISALILWGTENRAGQVAMAPISATLSQ